MRRVARPVLEGRRATGNRQQAVGSSRVAARHRNTILPVFCDTDALSRSGIKAAEVGIPRGRRATSDEAQQMDPIQVAAVDRS